MSNMAHVYTELYGRPMAIFKLPPSPQIIDDKVLPTPEGAHVLFEDIPELPELEIVTPEVDLTAACSSPEIYEVHVRPQQMQVALYRGGNPFWQCLSKVGQWTLSIWNIILSLRTIFLWSHIAIALLSSQAEGFSVPWHELNVLQHQLSQDTADMTHEDDYICKSGNDPSINKFMDYYCSKGCLARFACQIIHGQICVFN